MTTSQPPLFASIEPAPGLGPGHRVVCVKCGGTVIVNAETTVDRRWAFGHCPVCHKRRIFSVHTTAN